jgi:hypothetical protein
MQTLSSVFGAAFTLLTAYGLGVLCVRQSKTPPEITLALGAIAQSFLVFLLLLVNAAYWWAFAAVGVVAIGICWKTAGWRRLYRPEAYTTVILGAYGVWYLVNALAPEITPDGITYHLGLVREYVRLAGFPDPITFYDLVPQGMEMLYTAAYAFGRHPAAKLVEFAFFVATLPLIFRVGRRLGLSGAASLVPPVFFFCAPVIGLTGSSSYNDAAGVFFMLASLYLLLEERPFAAGLCAGFCYAIKMPGALVAVCAVLWMLARRRPRGAAIAALGAVIAMAPWVARSAVLTGNPLAPLANRVFPNPYFHIATEGELASDLRSLNGVQPVQVPWELAFGDRLHGTYGPLLLALPIGLLALRRREGRVLWIGAVILAIPWLTNSGARFLMQSLVLAAFALAMVLPQRAAWAAIAIQAILCWPHVLDRIQPPYSFRLHEFPIAAALGIEPEADYCKRHIEEYSVARMIESATPPDSRILALLSVANAYLDRQVAVWWQSAEADTLADTLRLASIYSSDPVFEWKASWQEQEVTALRFRIPKRSIPAGSHGEWDISEVRIFSGEDRVFNSPQWTFSGSPNRWEAPLAFDGNPATRWRTWEPLRESAHFDVEFGHVQWLTSAELTGHTPAAGGALEVDGRDAKGRWRLLPAATANISHAPRDLRLDAARALRRAGFRYLLVPTGSGGNAPIGNLLVGHEAEWGMERVGDAGRFYLLRVK